MTMPGRRALLVVAAVAALHAVCYAFIVPLWAFEDEEQHVDYVLSAAKANVPRIDDGIDERILESAFETERHVRLGFRTEQGPITGLETYSYMAYHPPGYAMVGAPVAWAAGGDPVVTVYGLRALGAAQAAALAVLVATAAGLVSPAQHRDRAALVGGLVVGLMPVVAHAGGRATNDLLVAVAVAAVTVASLVWIRTRSDFAAVAVGVAGAGAVGVKATAGVAVAAMVGIAALVVARSLVQWLAVVSPPLIAGVAWSAVLRARYGTVDGSEAFADAYGRPFEAAWPRLSDFVSRGFLPERSSSWGLIAPVSFWVLVGLAVVGGIALLRRRDVGGRWLVVVSAVVTMMVALLVALSAHRGHAIASPRHFLGVIALMAAVAGAGLAGSRRVLAAMPIATLMVVATVALVRFPGQYP